MSEPMKAMRLVDSEDLFVYPISSSERLKSHYFIALHYRRWLKSDFRNRADLDVRAVGFDLFCQAQDEAPVGTLPMDERLLAKLAGVTLEEWRRLCDRPITPLYGWSECRCDNGHSCRSSRSSLPRSPSRAGAVSRAARLD